MEDPMILHYSDIFLNSEWRYFIEPNDFGETRYRSFARFGDFWIAGNDQGDGIDDKRKISIFGLEHILFIVSDTTSEFGKHSWIMSDKNESPHEGMIVAVSRNQTIEFHHAFYSQALEMVQVFKL